MGFKKLFSPNSPSKQNAPKEGLLHACDAEADMPPEDGPQSDFLPRGASSLGQKTSLQTPVAKSAAARALTCMLRGREDGRTGGREDGRTGGREVGQVSGGALKDGFAYQLKGASMIHLNIAPNMSFLRHTAFSLGGKNRCFLGLRISKGIPVISFRQKAWWGSIDAKSARKG